MYICSGSEIYPSSSDDDLSDDAMSLDSPVHSPNNESGLEEMPVSSVSMGALEEEETTQSKRAKT